MKRLLIVFLVLMLFGCESDLDEYTSDVWDEIVDKEFSNYDVWAGQGVYFLETEDGLRCVYINYGSGVLVVGLVYHKVTILEDGSLVLSQIEIETPDGEVILESPVSDAIIIYKDGILVMNEIEFSQTDFSHYEQFIEGFKKE